MHPTEMETEEILQMKEEKIMICKEGAFRQDFMLINI
jgi:hypothetical protein